MIQNLYKFASSFFYPLNFHKIGIYLIQFLLNSDSLYLIIFYENVNRYCTSCIFSFSFFVVLHCKCKRFDAKKLQLIKYVFLNTEKKFYAQNSIVVSIIYNSYQDELTYKSKRLNKSTSFVYCTPRFKNNIDNEKHKIYLWHQSYYVNRYCTICIFSFSFLWFYIANAKDVTQKICNWSNIFS